MKKSCSVFISFFVAVMLACALFLSWYIPAAAGLRFRIDDLEISLDTSRGRERKQQAEYDQVVKDIPETRAKLDEALPLAQAAEEEVAALKAEKKKLKEEKKALEAGAAGAAEEAEGHE